MIGPSDRLRLWSPASNSICMQMNQPCFDYLTELSTTPLSPSAPTQHFTHRSMTGSVIRDVFSDFAVSRHLRQARRQLEQEDALSKALESDRRRAMKRKELAKKQRDRSKQSHKWYWPLHTTFSSRLIDLLLMTAWFYGWSYRKFAMLVECVFVLICK